eukprot:4925186-Pyramimonas_sp.AAC.1
MAVWLPWPIPDRELTIVARGFDCLEEHNCMLFLLDSADKLPKGAKPLPKGRDSRVGIDVKESGGVVVPLGPTRTRGRILFKVDPVSASSA